MNKKLLNPIRWIAVLPAAIISFIITFLMVFSLASIISHICSGSRNYYGNSFPFWHEKTWFVNYVAPLFANALAGFAFVKSGIIIAPTFKNQMGLILLLVMSVPWLIYDLRLSVYGDEFKYLQLGASILGAIVAWQFKTSIKKKSEF